VRWFRIPGLIFAALLALSPAARAGQTTLVTPGAPLTMAQLATFLNNAYNTIGTNFSGGSPPAVCSGSAACLYQYWLDTSTAPFALRINDGTQWVPIGLLDATVHTFGTSTPGYVNLMSFGADPTGVADSHPAWVAAVAALPAQGGAIYIPKGTYKFLTANSYTFTTSPAAIKVYGDGPDATILTFPNATYGVSINYISYLNSADISDLTITAGNSPSGAGLNLSFPGASNTPGAFTTSTVRNVQFRGADNTGSGGTDYWNYAIVVNGVSGTNISDVTVWGGVSTGVGILYEGAAGYFSVQHNLINFSANNVYDGVQVGTKVQGVNAVNFNSIPGDDGLKVLAGGTGVSEISMVNSQCTAINSCIEVLSATQDLNITGNAYLSALASVIQTGNVAVTGTIQGNNLVPYTQLSGIGVLIQGATSIGGYGTLMISNNLISMFATAISLTSTSFTTQVGWNTGVGNTAWITNAGTNNVLPTGTGSVVQATSPTLATPTLTTPVINGASTGTGVATANTVSTLVARDGSGNFAAGTITAALTGHASLDLALTGGTLTGAVSTNSQITSTLATGTAPFVVASTTNVANLNASSLSGATFAAPGAIGGGTAATGAFTTLTSGAHTITSASANAFAVGLNGATNPAFNVDSSTGSQAAGLTVIGAASGGTVAISAIDSGSNTNLSINPKGTGTFTVNLATGSAVFASTGSFTAKSTTSFNPQFTMENDVNDATGGYFKYNKSRGAGAAVQSGDYLGILQWSGLDTNLSFTAGANINAIVTAVGATTVTADLQFYVGGTYALQLVGATGQASFPATTDASSSTTGAVITAGGLGIAKAAYIGTFASVGTKIRAAGTAPALTSCGTSPAIVGSDLAGEVTMGTATPTGCIITFNVAYASAPYCVVHWPAQALASQSYTYSTTAITQTATSSNKIIYHCYARSAGWLLNRDLDPAANDNTPAFMEKAA
jgi:hypothetical protein